MVPSRTSRITNVYTTVSSWLLLKVRKHTGQGGWMEESSPRATLDSKERLQSNGKFCSRKKIFGVNYKTTFSFSTNHRNKNALKASFCCFHWKLFAWFMRQIKFSGSSNETLLRAFLVNVIHFLILYYEPYLVFIRRTNFLSFFQATGLLQYKCYPYPSHL